MMNKTPQLICRRTEASAVAWKRIRSMGNAEFLTRESKRSGTLDMASLQSTPHCPPRLFSRQGRRSAAFLLPGPSHTIPPLLIPHPRGEPDDAISPPPDHRPLPHL